jgi:hypothetical protein
MDGRVSRYMETEIGRGFEVFSDMSLKDALEAIWDILPCQWPSNKCRWNYRWSESYIESSKGKRL